MTFGSAIEGFATCLCQVLSKMIADTQIRHGDVVGSFVGTSLVVAGRSNFIIKKNCNFFSNF